jgi:hypothetical protein
MWQPNNLTKNKCTRLICERVLYLKIAFARIVEPATIGGLRFLSLSDMCSQERSKGWDRSLLHFGHSRPSDFRRLLSKLPILRFLLVLSLRYIGLAWVVLPKVARRSERLDLCSPVVPASPQIQQLLDSGFTSSEVPYLSFIDRPVWVATCCQVITRPAAAKCKAVFSRAHTSSTYDEERTATIQIVPV